MTLAFILKQWKFVAIIVLVIFLSVTLIGRSKDKAEIKRVTTNNSVLYGNFKSYKTANGKNAASVGVLTLKLNEFKQNEPLLLNEIASLKIKPKRVESVSKISMSTDLSVSLPLTSKIVYKDSVKCFEKKNKYLDLSGCYSKDSTQINLHIPVSITPVLHKIPCFTFLWIDFGIKEMRLDILCDNPYTQITSAKIIEFAK